MCQNAMDRHNTSGLIARIGRVTTVAMAILLTGPAFAENSGAATLRQEAGVDCVTCTAVGRSREMAFVQRFGDEVVGLMQRGALSRSAGRERFRRLLVDNLDVDSVSRSALGRYWRRASDVQLARYQAVYVDYVLATYGGLFGHYSVQTLRVTGSRPVSDAQALVEASIESSGGPPITLAFHVRRTDDGFKLVDVLVEGISMLVTQRSDFASVIEHEGMEGFLAHLEDVTGQYSTELTFSDL